jgi:hypothetical protein
MAELGGNALHQRNVETRWACWPDKLKRRVGEGCAHLQRGHASGAGRGSGARNRRQGGNEIAVCHGPFRVSGGL